MIVVESLKELEDHGTPMVSLTFGNFDGVHVGHQELIKLLKQKALSQGQALCVMTFVPHPRKILQAHAERFLLGSYLQRRRWLESLGVEYLVEIPFTRDFSTQDGKTFLVNHVFSYPNVKSIHLGWDFAFGANKQGDAEVVRELATAKNISVEVCPAFAADSAQVSSTKVRTALSQGQVSEARQLLGRYFSLEGIVVKGEGRGRRIGVPTANLQLDPDILVPHRGVYVTETVVRGINYRSVTNVGHNPTFEADKALTVETHIIDFSADLYGEHLEVRFVARLREEKKFPTVNDLIDQMKLDIQKGREFPIE